MAKTIVEIKVNADGSVDQEEVHLSVSKKQEVHWELVGSGHAADRRRRGGRGLAAPRQVRRRTLPGEAQGQPQANDRHPYHAVVNVRWRHRPGDHHRRLTGSWSASGARLGILGPVAKTLRAAALALRRMTAEMSRRRVEWSFLGSVPYEEGVRLQDAVRAAGAQGERAPSVCCCSSTRRSSRWGATPARARSSRRPGVARRARYRACTRAIEGGRRRTTGRGSSWAIRSSTSQPDRRDVRRYVGRPLRGAGARRSPARA
jgi:hypothetical protein